MKQTILAVLGTTFLAWGLAAAPANARATDERAVSCDDRDRRVERSGKSDTLNAKPPQRLGQSRAAGGQDIAEPSSSPRPASDGMLAILHRLSRIDGLSMAPFRLN